MSPDRKVVTVGEERVLRISCAGCSKGASAESSPDCLKDLLEALVKNPAVQGVVLADVYEREYRGDGLEALKEVADILRENRRWAFMNLTPKECTRCAISRKSRLERIFVDLGTDPPAALRKLKEFYHEISAKKGHGGKKCSSCREYFLDTTLSPLVNSIENCRILKNSKCKDGYAGVFKPLMRPCFLTSRLQLDVLDKLELIDAYEVDEAAVRIYRDRERLQNIYFVIPPEYHLPQEQVELMQSARKALLEDPPELDSENPHSRALVERRIEDAMADLVSNGKFGVTKEEVRLLSKYLTRFTVGLGLIDIILADERVQDVYLDSPVGRSPLHIQHRDHEECTTNVFLTQSDVDSLVSKFRAMSGRPFSEADPVLDMNLSDARLAVVGPPLSAQGVAMAIRRHKPTPWTLAQFVNARFMTPAAAGFLSLLVDANSSILLTGSRGAGKTSLLVSLMLELLPRRRIITVEDTSEIPVECLRKLGFKVQSLHVQSTVSSTDVELRAEDALKAALRLGESVLVIGEVRGNEARTLYEAMRVGMAGNSVMGTIHGATARDVFERVVYDLGIHPSSFKATDVIAVAAPIRLKGGMARARKLLQVTEVRKKWRKDPTAEGGFTDLFAYDYGKGEIRPTKAIRSSELIENIARKWSMRHDEIFRNLWLRSEIYRILVETARERKRQDLLESEFVVRSNLAWRGFFEEELGRGRVFHRKVLNKWRGWLEDSIGL